MLLLTALALMSYQSLGLLPQEMTVLCHLHFASSPYLQPS
jgi:hypothetical protein